MSTIPTVNVPVYLGTFGCGYIDRVQQISLYKSHFVPVYPQFCIIFSLLMIWVPAIYAQILQGTLIFSGYSGYIAPKSLCGAVPSDVLACGYILKGAGTNV